MSLPAPLQAAIEARLGLAILAASPLGGGCIHRALRIETSAGPRFCKWNSASQTGNFAAEAHGLAELRAAAGLRLPQVEAQIEAEGHAALVLELIDQAPQRADFWEVLGQNLAELHRHSAPAYGLARDNFIGSLPQQNAWEPDFYAFWAGQRLQPLLEQAGPQLEALDRSRAERLLNRLDRLIPTEAPALLHGDLWRGNLMADEQGGPCLIDPAVYYGHREAELAFTRLFGGFAPAFYACYHDAWPLADGWRERVDLFNLYPLLVHLVLFGTSYLRQVQAVLKKFGD